MKYIRTENGIYAFKEEMEIKIFYLNYSEGKPYLIFDDKKTKYDILGKVINQADTIEELCDEFVARSSIDGTRGFAKLSPRTVGCRPSIIEARKMNTIPHWDVYGAIWTSKGLIYVAKMNEKGELELI